jgi:hypothetical protein
LVSIVWGNPDAIEKFAIASSPKVWYIGCNDKKKKLQGGVEVQRTFVRKESTEVVKIGFEAKLRVRTGRRPPRRAIPMEASQGNTSLDTRQTGSLLLIGEIT